MAYDRGPQLFDPGQFSAGGGLSFQSGIVARAGGGRASATPITAAVNRIGVCATAADSVSLPPAVGGQMIIVGNGGVASCQVFAAPGTNNTIDSSAAATGIALASASKSLYFSPAPGLWYSLLSA